MQGASLKQVATKKPCCVSSTRAIAMNRACAAQPCVEASTRIGAMRGFSDVHANDSHSLVASVPSNESNDLHGQQIPESIPKMVSEIILGMFPKLFRK